MLPVVAILSVPALLGFFLAGFSRRWRWFRAGYALIAVIALAAIFVANDICVGQGTRMRVFLGFEALIMCLGALGWLFNDSWEKAMTISVPAGVFSLLIGAGAMFTLMGDCLIEP